MGLLLENSVCSHICLSSDHIDCLCHRQPHSTTVAMGFIARICRRRLHSKCASHLSSVQVPVERESSFARISRCLFASNFRRWLLVACARIPSCYSLFALLPCKFRKDGLLHGPWGLTLHSSRR